MDPAAAVDYAADPFCVSSRDGGAMGIHHVNGSLIGDGKIDASTPEILIYEPLPGGGKRLIGVEYIALAAEWDTETQGPPVLNGHIFNYSGAPNRYGIPAFYELHVWAWKYNPSGLFADNNPEVSCAAFDPALHNP